MSSVSSRARKSYHEAYERLAPFEQIARIAIMRRAYLGLSQQQVAERIESGQHRTGTETLRRLAVALDGHPVLGFEFGTLEPGWLPGW
jgi:hypothetical protein